MAILIARQGGPPLQGALLQYVLYVFIFSGTKLKGTLRLSFFCNNFFKSGLIGLSHGILV
jgi:hypothetical protein